MGRSTLRSRLDQKPTGWPPTLTTLSPRARLPGDLPLQSISQITK